MPYIPPSNQAKTRKTPEQIRAERIESVNDPKVQKEIDEMVKAREEKLAGTREEQRQRHEKDVAFMREQKLHSANGPQLAPPGMEMRPYLGTRGYERATNDAKAEVANRYNVWLRLEGKAYNDRIDKKLDHYERSREEGQSHSTSPGKKLVKFEDRFPDEAKREITR